MDSEGVTLYELPDKLVSRYNHPVEGAVFPGLGLRVVAAGALTEELDPCHESSLVLSRQPERQVATIPAYSLYVCLSEERLTFYFKGRPVLARLNSDRLEQVVGGNDFVLGVAENYLIRMNAWGEETARLRFKTQPLY